MVEPDIEGNPDGRVRLHASTTSPNCRITWVWAILSTAALALWLLLARTSTSWLVGAGLAAVSGALLVHGISTWLRARSIRRCLGDLVLTVAPCPARVGEPLEIHLVRGVRRDLTVRAVTLQLHCDAARVERYGAYDRSQRVWSDAFHAEHVALREARFGTGDVLEAPWTIQIPQEQHGSSDWTRWWIHVEMGFTECPSCTATFPLDVVRDDNRSEAPGGSGP